MATIPHLWTIFQFKPSQTTIFEGTSIANVYTGGYTILFPSYPIGTVVRDTSGDLRIRLVRRDGSLPGDLLGLQC